MQMTHCPRVGKEFSQILGEPKTRKEVLEEIYSDNEVRRHFESFSESLKEELITFCMGNRGLKITYDPFFKFIFSPIIHPERLSELLSLIFGEEVEVVEVLPNESSRITESGTLLITDIVVRLRDGSYANVEIQKIGYKFPGQRCASYSSDLLQRQLIRAKNAAKRERRSFSYGDLKKVYTIVLIEESPAIYWQHPNVYIHRGKQRFDTGLELDLLQEFIIIPLDVFRKIEHNEISKLEAWLYFIGSDSPKDICRIVEAYPEFKELYNEMIGLRYDLKELSSMFDYYRKILKEFDEGTIQYMVEEQKKELEEIGKQLQERQEQLQQSQEQLQQSQEQLQESQEQLQESQEQLQESQKKIEEKEQEIVLLKAKIEQLKRTGNV